MWSFILLWVCVIFVIYLPEPVYPQLGKTNLEDHIHVNLAMKKDGKDITIPSNIGIDPRLTKDDSFNRYSLKPDEMSALHTHEDGGRIHVESTIFGRFTLGDFLGVWGMDQSKIERIYSDGQEIDLHNYASLPLENEQNLTIIIKPDNFTKDLKYYFDSESGLFFKYPANWNLTSIVPQNSSIGENLLNILQLTPEDVNFLNTPFLTPNLRIEVTNTSSNNMTLDKLIIANLPKVLQETKNDNKNTSLLYSIASNSTEFNGNYAQEIEVVTSDKKNIQIWTKNIDKLYFISYSGITSDNITSFTYDYFLPGVENILRSIKIN